MMDIILTGARLRERTKSGVITARDILACRFVCEQGVMTVDQLWRAVWWTTESSSARYAYQRVAFLVRSGLLVALRSPYSLKTFFKATRRAQETAGAFGPGQAPIPLQSPPINEIPHSDGLTELRLAVMRAQPDAKWVTDRVLSIDPLFPRERFFNHIPDAIWTTPRGTRIAVEFERTRKSPARTRSKIETFSREMSRTDRAFDRVLWIGVPSTLTSLSAALVRHPRQTLRTHDQFILELQHDNHRSRLGE